MSQEAIVQLGGDRFGLLMAESVERLRTWASGRCLSADKPGIYRRAAAPATRSARKISRDPSAN